MRHPVAWNALISRSLLVGNDVWFNTDVYCREDLIFNLELLRLNFKGAYTFTPTYTYRHCLPNSLSNTVTKRNIESFVPIIRTLIEVYENTEDKSVRKNLYKELTCTTNGFFKSILRLNRKNRIMLLDKYGKEVEGHIISTDDLTILSKLYRISPSFYKIVADSLGCLMPKRYRVCD